MVQKYNISRSEQANLFKSLEGNIILNTEPDGSGTNLNIIVGVHWGFQPEEYELPAIIIRFIDYNKVTRRTLGDVWGELPEGQFIGHIAEFVLMVKCQANDFTSGEDFIEKTDIAETLMERVIEKAVNDWDSIIENGSVVKNGISSVNDASIILNNESFKDLQFTIRLQKLTGGVPDESGNEIKFSTAPTLIEVESSVDI
jgi:hypothetical protein